MRAAFKANPWIFVGTLSALCIWVTGYAYFTLNAQWSGICDHSGRRIARLVKQLYCSPELLTGGAMEWGLFMFLWVIPAILLGLVVWVALRTTLRRR